MESVFFFNISPKAIAQRADSKDVAIEQVPTKLLKTFQIMNASGCFFLHFPLLFQMDFHFILDILFLAAYNDHSYYILEPGPFLKYLLQPPSA